MRVSPHLQWTLRGCLEHHTHPHHHHHSLLAEQTRSWFAGKGPTVYRLPCTQDYQTTHRKYIYSNSLSHSFISFTHHIHNCNCFFMFWIIYFLPYNRFLHCWIRAESHWWVVQHHHTPPSLISAGSSSCQ